MRQEINKKGDKKMKNQQKRITFSTLKMYARKGMLLHRVEGEHGAYGMEYYRDDNELALEETGLEDLAKFKVTKNWLNEVVGSVETTEGDTFDSYITLSNCCYMVNFYVVGEVMAWRFAMESKLRRGEMKSEFHEKVRGNLPICDNCGVVLRAHEIQRQGGALSMQCDECFDGMEDVSTCEDCGSILSNDEGKNTLCESCNNAYEKREDERFQA